MPAGLTSSAFPAANITMINHVLGDKRAHGMRANGSVSTSIQRLGGHGGNSERSLQNGMLVQIPALRARVRARLWLNECLADQAQPSLFDAHGRAGRATLSETPK